MITDGINGIGCDLSYRLAQDTVDILGPERLAMIDEVAYGSVVRQVVASVSVAASGALRWPTQFRPEVLIDATGRLL